MTCNILKTAIILCALGASISYAQGQRLDGRRSLSKTTWGYAVEKDRVRAGAEGQRFELRPGDCYHDAKWDDCKEDRERSEIEITRNWNYGTDRWIGFSVFVPAGFTGFDRGWTTFAQIHQNQGMRAKNSDGTYSSPNHMQLAFNGSHVLVAYHVLNKRGGENVPEREIIATQRMIGKWTDFAIHFDTMKNNGLLEVYVDGKNAYSVENTVSKRPQNYYFKYGIYRSPISKIGSAIKTQVLYFDEVRMGSTLDAVTVRTDSPVD